MRLLGPVYDSMVQHAHDDAPSECVGLLLRATDSDVYTARMPLANRSAYPDKAFWVDPYEQYRAEMAAEKDGLVIGAVYHSHVDNLPLPSDTDCKQAHPNYFTVIISVLHEEVAVYMPDGNGELFPVDFTILIGANHA
jgi:proteasome lid subunit RPN8/RPN11